jgi:general secretion pathway protein D
VNLVGGIIEDTEALSLSGYPWISKIPLLKYLFAQDNNHRTQSEIVFAITPHIVRSQEVTEDNLASIEVGTGSSIELRRKPPVPPAATAQAVPPPSASGPSRPATAPTSAQTMPAGQ